MRDSNPRPSPCKGNRNMQVRTLSRANLVPLSICEYLGVPVSRGAGVVQKHLIERCSDLIVLSGM